MWRWDLKGLGTKVVQLFFAIIGSLSSYSIWDEPIPSPQRGGLLPWRRFPYY